MPPHSYITQRSVLVLLAAVAVPSVAIAQSPEKWVTMYKDPSCSCCGNWQRHLQAAGFNTAVEVITDMAAVKTKFGVPVDLVSCHTAVIAGYVVEGHVPAGAINRPLAEKPAATGLAVPGMPAGAPGMDVSTEPYEVILFGPAARRTYAHFVSDREV